MHSRWNLSNKSYENIEMQWNNVKMLEMVAVATHELEKQLNPTIWFCQNYAHSHIQHCQLKLQRFIAEGFFIVVCENQLAIIVK